MSRQLKFRGKRIDNGEWIYGWVFGNNAKSIIEIDKEYPSEYGVEAYYTSVVIPETVGQYTGLKDKNGKEIYEGDILRVTDEADEVNALNSDTGIGVVEWLDKWGFWNISNIENGLGDILCYGYVEIIGNIYEDKHLLEV